MHVADYCFHIRIYIIYHIYLHTVSIDSISLNFAGIAVIIHIFKFNGHFDFTNEVEGTLNKAGQNDV